MKMSKALADFDRFIDLFFGPRFVTGGRQKQSLHRGQYPARVFKFRLGVLDSISGFILSTRIEERTRHAPFDNRSHHERWICLHHGVGIVIVAMIERVDRYLKLD